MFQIFYHDEIWKNALNYNIIWNYLLLVMSWSLDHASDQIALDILYNSSSCPVVQEVLVKSELEGMELSDVTLVQGPE